MKIIQQRMPENFSLYLMSDIHIGSPNCCYDTINSTIAKIKDEGAYMAFLGDAIDAVTPKDKRFSYDGVDYNFKTPHDQAKEVVNIMEPIKDNIVSWLMGNHEFKLNDTFQASKFICESLEIPYGAYVCQTEFQDKAARTMFKTHLWHGAGHISSNAKDKIQHKANRQASLKLKLSKTGFDDVVLMAMGHTHQLEVVEPTVYNELSLYTENGKIHQKYKECAQQNANYIPPDSRWYVNTGSFLKLYGNNVDRVSYGELVGYAPAEIGCIKVEVNNKMITNVSKVVC